MHHSFQAVLIKPQPQAKPHLRSDRNAVSITEVGDRWHVLIEEFGQRPIARSFRDERRAINTEAKGSG